MKQWVIAGTLAGSLALGGGAVAQTTPAAQPQTKPAGSQTTDQKVTKPRPKPSTEAASQGETRTPKQQPPTAPDPDVAVAASVLGTVHIPKAVKADGKPLAAGAYQVRLTTEEAKPDAVGTSGKTERWVEFVQKGQVKGREVVTIVPASEIKLVQKDTPPPANGSKVQMLKGNDYMRVWINKAGNHYLIHLVPA